MLSKIKRDYICQLAADGKRMDGRKFDETREIKIEKGVAKNAEGSTRVKLGDTTVMVGVKMAPGEPYPDTQDSGVLTTAAELIPLASPTFESGPPSPIAIELARVVDRGIRESKTVDFKKLCITQGEKVWVLFLDIHVLDYDGNLFDASSIGALSALTDTVVPANRFELGEDFKLSVEHYPVSCTSVKIGNTIMLDPSLDEETAADARLTVSIDENGDIRAMQKGLNGSFTLDEIKSIINISKIKGDRIRELIK
ncbi:MAG: exosome complex protein Rrp42 [Candidatus Thermoplasmatota archaeon]|nr:exosome complex protein Rrp42 [Candidatus Thermoplasmatota archaeon]MBU3901812.1 exosome complex protein Rrp42 [Candidatus Thermoplasmatota archaeon]MBU4189483.1 exosome complex protein Rrp42 [Candidatus Thermoplasmatota archaeon]MBU4255851.1 exosome complex protein Rrp42 [Candidatus Thermoplasmatota archaeon]MCG2826681.1 exosome complex protein Rrp42 [Thermoplasmatales archaeon]